ncbi:MAG: hypothetical protein HF314_08730 [Ignavibacteria bacterium]|jgi:uncharacterized lipoprotein YehR (DUF1307 family)|nr:hypothetical protein [Ignavibacteria bacterium]MCU7503145.1 hypothetical protein [Ignavibacteria bacterium]MCU7518023.1 hypothetical protein [Ignavibacteria bacterium]
MKLGKYLTVLFITVYALLLTGCDVTDENRYLDPHLQPPTNVYSVNGDNRVDIYWDLIRNNNVAGYNVYYSYSYDGDPILLGSTQSDHFVDFGAKNGDTYYYAVTSYDYNGNESDLSYEEVKSTPRPEGFNQSVFDYRRFPEKAGYEFTSNSVVQYDSKNSDFFFENYQGRFYLDVWDDSDIMDMGPTRNIYDVQTAPSSGWSPTKDTLAVVGHTYVIWTFDNHYAKIRVTSITNERITFDWAYQTVEGNRMLKQKSGERKPLSFDENKHHRSLLK